jgi:hypothetical protein
MIFWGQAGIGLPLFYFSREGADIGIWVGGASWRPSGGSSGKGPPIPGPMPYLYALIEAAEREAVLSHPHAVEGFGMGEGFARAAGNIGQSDPLRDSLFHERGWLIRRPMRPAPPEKAA